MRNVLPFFVGLLLAGTTLAQTNLTLSIEEHYGEAANRLIKAATESDAAFERVAYICDTFGPRFSGTTNLENSIDWILSEMKKDGMENVRGDEVMVPHWVRGNESVELLEPHFRKMKMLGLGGSVATPEEGITAEVFVVRNFEELINNPTRARGKIVVFNAPFTEYSSTVLYRTRGAMEAARAGAVASLVRSVATFSLYTPHTGGMRYSEDIKKIPHAAITMEDAEMMQRMQERGKKIVVRLKMEAKTLPMARSRNVIAEIVGREKPEEIIVVSGHIDAWDVGQGAMDDAGGCVAAWEAVRLMHKLNLRPRRTVRVVLWTNEENGLRGAREYREKYKADLKNHVLAIESDEGVFKPHGFAFTGTEKATATIRQIMTLLKPIGATQLTFDASGADISQLEDDGVPLMDLRVESSKYFWYHHTEADTVDKLDKADFNQCVAAMAVMSYIVAELPERLPPNPVKP
ncbi:MAG: M20/M25/M40 family metallo-hydrolase [Verrucomicrobia bacterium]|nr:M20/M25/M40 family metallo-hydrolase [Verrucomicrobiota bacterium]